MLVSLFALQMQEKFYKLQFWLLNLKTLQVTKIMARISLLPTLLTHAGEISQATNAGVGYTLV